MGFKEALLSALGRKPEEAQTLSDEDALKLLVEEFRKPADDPPTPEPAQDNPQPKMLSAADIEAVLNDIRGLNSDAARQKMAEVMDDLRKSNAELQASLRLTEAHQRVKQLAEGSRGFIPTMPQQEHLLRILHEAPKPVADEVFKLFLAIKEKGVVDLSERGATRPNDEVDLGSASDDPRDIFMRHVSLVEQERKVSTYEAMSIVASEKPQLYDRYRKAADINAGVN